MDLASTIVACGSAPGRSLRSVVRVSGAACAPLFEGIGGRFERGVRRARIAMSPRASLPCTAYCSKGPSSYTGDDTLELVLPGNADLVESVLRELLARAERLGLSARMAAPGEFTLRAFARGKLDLTRAEGVAATIAASTELQLRAARQLADGGLGRFVAELAERTADDLALVEAGIDFTDQEDVVAIEPAVLAGHVATSIDAIRSRLARSVPMERFEAVPRVVLVGSPNAGKSTLFNALLGRRRAVESPIAGTTRDVLEEVVMLDTPRGRCEVRLVDVAGVDASVDGFNPAMQERVRAAVEAADVVVECVAEGAEAQPPLTLRDISPGEAVGEREFLACAHPLRSPLFRSPPAPPGERSAPPTEGAVAPRIVISTKADLHVLPFANEATHSPPLRSPPAQPGEMSPKATEGAVARLAVSAHTHQGLDALRAAIVTALASRVATLTDETVILAARHESSLRDALAALETCEATLAATSLRAPELVAASLRTALDALGAISGQIAPDDVLGRIFGKFCVGK